MSSQEFEYQLYGILPSLFNQAYFLTKSEEDAKDLIQETVLKALKNIEKFSPGSNLKAWMYTIMRNTFLNIVKRDKVVLADSYDIPVNNMVKNEIDGELSKDYEDILSKVNNLPEEFKTPFIMHYEGFKYDEISEKLNIPLSKVKNRIHHARKKLIPQLKEHYDAL